MVYYDCRHKVPQGLSAATDTFCRTSFESKLIESSESLKKELGVTANIEGGYGGFSFSASSEYKQASSTLETGSSKIIESSATCKYFYTELDRYNLPDFTAGVGSALRQMNQGLKSNGKIDSNVAFRLFDDFGTHFPVELQYGARFTYQYKLTTSAYESLKSSSLSVEAQASYSGLASVSGGSGMTTAQENAVKKFQENSLSTTKTVGAPPPADGKALTWASEVKTSPLPVKYKLAPISDILFDRRNSHLVNYIEDTYIDAAKQAIDQLMGADYARYLEQNGIHLKVDNSAVVKFRDYAIAEYDEEKSGIDYDRCRDICMNRRECVALSSYVNKCRLDDDDEPYRKLSYKSGSITMIVKENLVREMGLKELQYSSSVARITEVNIKGSSNYDVLKSFCKAVCVADDQCTGFELSDRQNMRHNCATYRSHSQSLTSTAKHQFETHIMPNHVKTKEKQSLRAMAVVKRFGGFGMSGTFSNSKDRCEFDCCKRLCISYNDCSAFRVRGSGTCSLVRSQDSVSLVRASGSEIIGILPDSQQGGWFNMTGYVTSNSGSYQWQARSQSSCADICAQDVTCVVASWVAPQSKCYTFDRHSYLGSAPSYDVNSALMFPSTAVKIEKLSL